ncbi:MAG TPA: hypothetical protein VIJ28_21485 [Chloroflexota bacterium]
MLSSRPFAEIHAFPSAGGGVGILSLDNPKLTTSHFVALDAPGVVDPAVDIPDHLELEDFLVRHLSVGTQFHMSFLMVGKLQE